MQPFIFSQYFTFCQYCIYAVSYTHLDVYKRQVYNTKLLKNKTELEAKSKQIEELEIKTSEQKSEIVLLRNKNLYLLSNSKLYADEKKKYFSSVINAIEKEISYERYKFPNKDRMNLQKLIPELSEIFERLSKNNLIPSTTFDEISNDKNIINRLVSLFRYGNPNNIAPKPKEIPSKKEEDTQKNTITKNNPVSYTHLDVYKRQVKNRYRL